MQLLQDLGAYSPGSAIYETSLPKAITAFVYDQVSNRNVQVNPKFGDSAAFKTVNHSRLIKFAAGEVVGDIDDPYIINGEVTGKGVLLYAAQELDEKYLEKIPHKVIRVSDECQFSKITADDCWWLQTCLLCHGFHLLTAAEEGPSSKPISLDQALRKFATNFCEERTGLWIEQKHFHEQFKRYCDICLTVEKKVPGSTILARYVKKELLWESIEIRSRNNRLAFKGIVLDEDKLEQAIQEAQEHNASQPGQVDSDDFDAYVDSFKSYLHIPE